MVESDSYGSDYFPIILKIGVSLPDALPRWNLNRADWVQFDNVCKEKLTLDTIELYEEPIVLFTDILCSIAKSCMPRTTAKQKKRCKPWFNTECKDVLKARKSALVRFKTNITTDNQSNFNVARAKARRACRENKRASWQQYVSRLNSRTTLKSTWDMVRRISGKYKANIVSHLKSNNNDITDVKEICNILAEQFAFNSSSDNYSHMFNRYRLKLEKKTIDFDTNDHYSYNDVFTLHELKQAIKVSRDTSPGIDTVHYQLLKHLHEDSLGSYRKVLLRLYRALIRSKLDYGCIVYGSARPSYIKRVDTVHNQGLRLCLGAFRTSPVQSLYVEANEPPLDMRRARLSLQYGVKLMSNEVNPAYSAVFQSDIVATFEAKERAIKPLGLRIERHLDGVGFHTHVIAPYTVMKTPPWKLIVPTVYFDLCKYKKSDTNPTLYRLHYSELLESFTDYTHIFTDGSKDGDKTAAAFICQSFEFSKRLPAELEAIVCFALYKDYH